MSRRLAFAVLASIFVAFSAQAEGFRRLGVFGGFTSFADVEKSKFAYGARWIGPLAGDWFGAEFSATDMRDTNLGDQADDLRLWNLALSARLRGTLIDMLGQDAGSVLPGADAVGFYIGGGAAYNLIHKPDWADNKPGYQVFVGAEMETGLFGEVFVEYRYNFLDIKGGPEDMKHDMGLVKLGASFKF